MGLGLKTERMNTFLHESAGDGAQFTCKLWGVILASPAGYFQMGSTATLIAQGFLLPGVAGSLSNAFCYIGCTNDSLHIIAVDTFKTERPVARFVVPFAQMQKVRVKKALVSSSYFVEIDCVLIDPGDDEDPEPWELPAWFRLQIKNTTIGTDIKDQKENAEVFRELLQNMA